MNRQAIIIITASLVLVACIVAATGLGVAILLVRSTPPELKLPESVLAVDEKPDNSIVVHVIDTDRVRIRNQEGSLDDIVSLLEGERSRFGDVSAADCTVTIAARHDLPTSIVQQVIRTCQDAGYEKFVLRAAE